jgi:ubiquinone/menaquinone biosynthesis C-methylase UbiE
VPIIKVINSTEKYRAISKSLTKRHFLTGRGSNKKLTLKRISNIKTNLSQIKVKNRKSERVWFENMADIGCGDGSFMENLINFGNNFVGILPTQEEVEVVKKYLKNHNNIFVMKGLSTKLPFEDESKQFLLCNSVLHSVGFDDDLVKNTLYEFYRVLNRGGILYIGEIPELNEMEGRDYGYSFYKYLIWVLRNRNISNFFKELMNYLKCFFSKEIYILQPTNIYFCPKIKFIKLLQKVGFKVEKICDSKNNKTILFDDIKIERRRLDYICTKDVLT